MVTLGGWVFLMSEVPLYPHAWRVTAGVAACPPPFQTSTLHPEVRDLGLSVGGKYIPLDTSRLIRSYPLGVYPPSGERVIFEPQQVVGPYLFIPASGE
jgi:hypothetical protein